MVTNYFIKSGIILALLLSYFCANAQHCSVVRGTVRDAQTGEYLPGAHVKHMSKGLGAGSDSLGNFSLTVSIGDTLTVSYVGYENRMVIVTECSITITLVPTSQNINEVVVSA